MKEISASIDRARNPLLLSDDLEKFIDSISEEPRKIILEERTIGVVKWFNDAKGFGFITEDKSGEDALVHFTAIEMDGFRRLQEGQRVTFKLIDGPKGKTAQEVRIIT